MDYIPLLFLINFVTRCTGFLNTEQRTVNDISDIDIQEPGCPKIQQLQALVYPKALVGEWRVLFFGSAVGNSTNSRLLTLLKYSGLQGSCVKVKFIPVPSLNESDSIVRVVTKWSKTGATFDLICSPTETIDSKWMCHDHKHLARINKTPKSEGFYLFIIQDEIGGLPYMLLLECNPKYSIHWSILTKDKVIDPRVIKWIMKKVQRMGLNPGGFMRLSHDKCYTN